MTKDAERLLKHYRATQADAMNVPPAPFGYACTLADSVLLSEGYTEKRDDGLLYLSVKGMQWTEDEPRQAPKETQG